MTNDWMDFGADFPAEICDAVKAQVFAWRIFHNLADDAFKMRFSDAQFRLSITPPDGRLPTSQTIGLSGSAAQRVVGCLHAEYQAWQSRTKQPLPPNDEPFEGGPFSNR
jgi:hypothetical protein